jgi:transcription antitermination factor NusG
MGADNEPVWHVLHVKPRCEKKMGEYCGAHAVACELPLREETKVYQRRRVTVHKPVFPGYVFVHFSAEERVSVLKSNLVVRDLPVVDQAHFVRQLEQIRQALSVDPTLNACEAFTAGRRVRITAGPFMGLEGVVQTVRGKTRVLLNVEMIGRALSVEVGIEMLERAD